MKKILSISLVLALMLSVLSLPSFSADEYSTDDDIISGDYNYEFLEDGTIGINRYFGTADEVVIPSEIDGYKVTALHRYSFAGHEDLKSVTVPEGVTRIGYWAFEDCYNLEELILPDSLREMSSSYIDETKVYKDKSNWENGVLYINNHLIDSDPDMLSGTFTVKKGTISIAKSALSDCTDITEVILPESMVYIGDAAFEDCENLQKINLPDSITHIDFCAFDGDSKLSVFEIPKNISIIGPYAFRGTAVSEINLPESLEKIDYSAFASCKNLTSVEIPESVTYLGDGVFSGCSQLAEITLPKNLEHLGDSLLHNTAYYNDKANWDSGLLYHGTYLLDSDPSISGKVYVKNGTTMVATRTFCFRDKVSYISLPDSVEYIGAQCFGGTDILREIKLPKNLKTLEAYAFLNCPALEKVIIPEGVTEIPMEAFFCCENLDYIRIPASVATIDEYAIGYTDPYYDQGDVIVGPESYLKNENLVIAGYKGTAAEQYAKANGFKFKDLDVAKEYKYKDKVLDLLQIPEEDPGTGEGWLAYYREGYEYYSDPSTADEATPDYVLIKAYINTFGEAFAADVYGEYVLRSNEHKFPATFGYFIYLPKTNEIYSLQKAFDMELEGVYNVFTEGGVGELLGDVNYDRKLNIRDATLIQKHLAGIERIENNEIQAFLSSEYTDVPCFIGDFNCDGKMNIRDATAIQKHIAGL